MTVVMGDGKEIRQGAELLLKETFDLTAESARALSPLSGNFEEMCRELHTLGPEGIRAKLKEIEQREATSGREVEAKEGRQPVEVAPEVAKFVGAGEGAASGNEENTGDGSPTS